MDNIKVQQQLMSRNKEMVMTYDVMFVNGLMLFVRLSRKIRLTMS